MREKPNTKSQLFSLDWLKKQWKQSSFCLHSPAPPIEVIGIIYSYLTTNSEIKSFSMRNIEMCYKIKAMH